MTVEYTKNFIKQSKKLNPKLRNQLVQRITLFSTNPLDSQLRDHQLKGQYKQYRSIDVTGDYRALYKVKENEQIILIAKIDKRSRAYD